MPKPQNSGPCSVEGCEGINSVRGFCRYHYHRFRRTKAIEKSQFGDRTTHPFYILWWQRKVDGYLSEEWLDFNKFIKDISPKPEGNYFLVRLRNEPFGPNNFQWQEHLKRKEGENKKEWWDRKRRARLAANPSMESDRNLKRFFNLTREQYNEISASQNNACAICKKPETAPDARTGTIKKLAVDHCHNSKLIRGLLCNRCNTTLGKAEDNVGLLQAMIDYLNKHKEV